MNFKYQKFPVDPSNSPNPTKRSALRPVIKIAFDGFGGRFSYLVLTSGFVGV